MNDDILQRGSLIEYRPVQYVAQWNIKIVDVVSLMSLTTSPPSHFIVLRSIPPAPISSSRSNGCADDRQYARQWRRSGPDITIPPSSRHSAIDLIVVFAMSHAVGISRVRSSSLRAHGTRPRRCCHRSGRRLDGIYASFASPHLRAMRIASIIPNSNCCS